MNYFSVGKEAVEEIIIKKSRFIGYVTPVYDEEGAQYILEYVREQWPQARHYCYAYILKENNAERYSDDGEPSGTAGVPILSVLRNNNLKNAMIVVTRYFGGTLLGAPGLVRAYTQASSLAIQTAGIKRFDLCTHLQITCDYTYWGNIEHKLLQEGILVNNIDYQDKVIADIYCPVNDVEAFKNKVITFSNGTADITTFDQVYKSLE